MKKKTTRKKPMLYKNYEKFAKRVGILEEEALKALGWKCDNGNRISTYQLADLRRFVENLNKAPSNAEKFILGKSKKKQKHYHICTDYDSSELEDSYCKEKGIDPEEGSVFATVMDNRVGFVNRMDYLLCDGEDNEGICLEEIEDLS